VPDTPQNLNSPKSTPIPKETADKKAPKKPRARKQRREIGGVPIAVVKESLLNRNYIARADQVNDDDRRLMEFLYDTRTTTRSRFIKAADPLAFHYDLMPARLRRPLTPEELARRKGKAKALAYETITRLRPTNTDSAKGRLGALGFVDVTAQRAKVSEIKARALRECTGVSEARGRTPELLTLNKDAVFYVKRLLGLDDDAPPSYKVFEGAHSHIAHQLVTSDVLLALSAYEQAERLCVVDFYNEYSWVEELTDGRPATYRQGRILVSDIYITVQPWGAEPGEDEETYLVEVDCGNQLYQKPTKKRNPTVCLPVKFTRLWTLAKKSEKQSATRRGITPPINLAIVVPPWARVKPSTRARAHRKLFEDAWHEHRGPEQDLVRLICQGPMEDPTPDNFALFLALRMESLRQARLKATGPHPAALEMGESEASR
jgi:hypothetical protein